MIKTYFIIALFGLFVMASGSLYAYSEECYVTNEKGENLIKAGQEDNSSNPNVDDERPWINVPMGQCNKINRGKLEGVSAALKAKININGLPR